VFRRGITLFIAPALAWNEPHFFLGIKWGAKPADGLAALQERSLEEPALAAAD
jgi:hypothetical protein